MLGTSPSKTGFYGWGWAPQVLAAAAFMSESFFVSCFTKKRKCFLPLASLPAFSFQPR
jgi:hypothetical protein